jgi:hypothetical protein
VAVPSAASHLLVTPGINAEGAPASSPLSLIPDHLLASCRMQCHWRSCSTKLLPACTSKLLYVQCAQLWYEYEWVSNNGLMGSGMWHPDVHSQHAKGQTGMPRGKQACQEDEKAYKMMR